MFKPLNDSGAAETAHSSDRYRALLARDARFDGRFFVGVTSTGIYCRPVCRVKVPQLRNCRFFDHPAAAESAGFRPCLRCRPELAPGLSRVDSSNNLAWQAASLLEIAATAGTEVSIPRVAARLGVTDRHLRRIFTAAVGVSPLAYLNTRRLLQAKQLLTDTRLSATEVAFAAGFRSVRRFNAAFAEHYRLSPTRWRQSRPRPGGDVNCLADPVQLGFRPPFDGMGLRRFLAQRAVNGLEAVGGSGTELRYCRTLAVMQGSRRHAGWLSLQASEGSSSLSVWMSEGLLPAMPSVIQRIRHAMDLDADPSAIDAAVETMGFAPRPGLRLPGAFDGFESAVRIVLGQQVSVAAARTLTQRLVETFGERLADNDSGLQLLFPTSHALAMADAAEIGRLGIVRQRVAAIQAIARAVEAGDISLQRDAPLEPTLAALRALPGIGEWTVQMIAMRALAWPDALPSTDQALLRALDTRNPAQAEHDLQSCRPWRAYGVMRAWQTLESPHESASLTST